MSDIEKQIEELEATANERALIAQLTTREDVRVQNEKLAQQLLERLAMLRGKVQSHSDCGQ